MLLFFSQKYRHVDNIMFENHTIADRFLDFWRKTGSQRMGYLYGRFTEHKDIPLGIRAEVAAIYEPPQVRDSFWMYHCLLQRFESSWASCGFSLVHCNWSFHQSNSLINFVVTLDFNLVVTHVFQNATQNSLELIDDPKAAAVDEIAAKLGLCKVGLHFSFALFDFVPSSYLRTKWFTLLSHQILTVCTPAAWQALKFEFMVQGRFMLLHQDVSPLKPFEQKLISN